MFERRIRVEVLVKFEGHRKIHMVLTVYIEMKV